MKRLCVAKNVPQAGPLNVETREQPDNCSRLIARATKRPASGTAINKQQIATEKIAAIVGALFLILSQSGCTNWSGDVGQYREILGRDRAVAPAAFESADALTLIAALRLADADNETIASRGEDYIQALAEKMRQAGTFLPTISLAPSYSLANGAAVSTVGLPGTIQQLVGGSSGTVHQFTVPLNASITGSLANAANWQAAGRTAEQRAQLLLDERETILLQVVQSYYAVLKAERQSAVYESSLRFKAEKVRDQEARLRLGNVRPLDLAQTQADLAATRVSLVQSRSDSSNARSALARLIGVRSINGPLSDAFDPPADVPTLDQWQRQAPAARQDLIAAARAVAAARFSLEAAIREYFPSVTINFSYFLYNDPATLEKWSSVFSPNIPIFSALAIEADIRKAWSVYRQAGLLQTQTWRQVVDDVNQNFQNLQGSREKIADLQVEVEAAQRAFELSERAYQLGSVSNLDRLTQQDNLLSAQLNLVSEQFNEKSNYLGVLRSVGRLSSVLGNTH
ncbi:MAG TPA: TolC family protein [Tepidisphaeraceae bacterium]|nr:TolC family protein [Tepidisphaeraceae bacterium]